MNSFSSIRYFFLFSSSSALSCLRRILPTFVFGSSLRNSISVGSLYVASFVLQYSISSSWVAVSPP